MKATRKEKKGNFKIEITLTRKVNDKVAYADGYNIATGREIYERYEVKMFHKPSGKTIRASGKLGSFAFFSRPSKFSTMPKGAYARIGDAYINEEIYNIAMTMIAELDAEVGKSDEQAQLEAEQAQRKEEANRRQEEEAAEYARKIKNGFCPKCQSYCYGDCEAN